MESIFRIFCTNPLLFGKKTTTYHLSVSNQIAIGMSQCKVMFSYIQKSKQMPG